MYKKLTKVSWKNILLIILICSGLSAQTRKEINLPDIPGYFTLKCDFHMHTPFSDGTVWPPDRVTEAWMEGLDAISITDHVEYHAYKMDVKIRPNRAYEMAKSRAEELGILFVHGAEITRDMPPGHFNALFIQNDSLFTVKDPMKALDAAAKQNAFIIWNHPGWKGQQLDGIARWYDEHTQLYEKGWMKGIEIVNETEYYPKVFQWAIDKKLTLFGNSDIHSPIGFKFDAKLGQHRPLTLVFAKDRTLDAIREAMESRRTAVYYEDRIFGHEKELSALFAEIVEVKNSMQSVYSGSKFNLQLHNHSDLDLILTAGSSAGFMGPKKIHLPAHLTIRIPVEINRAVKVYEQVKLEYSADNILTEPETPLKVHVKAETVNLSALKVSPAGEKNTFQFDPVKIPNVKIVYTIDGSEPEASGIQIKESFKAEGPIHLKIKAFKDGRSFGGRIIKNISAHSALGTAVQLKNAPSPKYSGIGPAALTDGQTGSLDYKDGSWMGFEQTDLSAIVDFEKQVKADCAKVRFLDNQHSWIFLPKELRISISDDGESFRQIYEQKIPLQENKDKGIRKFECAFPKSDFRYLRIEALNQDTCPEWHSGAGGKAWLFIDEIIIE